MSHGLRGKKSHDIFTIACIFPLTHVRANFCYKATQFAFVMVFQTRGSIVGLIALLAPVSLPAAQVRPNSILLLDRSDLHGAEATSAVPYGRAVIGRREPNGGISAIISISDLGPLVPAAKRAEVFDPFFTTKQQGMGIGLSIARTIVQAHKGATLG